MINRNKVEQEYKELLKDQKLQKTVENETSILKNLIICCLVAFGFISLIENTNDFIFITIFITHLLLSLNNQKLMDRYITGYITNIYEISKVLATISKSHYNFIYIKSALFLIFYLIYIAMPSAYILYDLSLCIMIFEITMVFYYYILLEALNTFKQKYENLEDLTILGFDLSKLESEITNTTLIRESNEKSFSFHCDTGINELIQENLYNFSIKDNEIIFHLTENEQIDLEGEQQEILSLSFEKYLKQENKKINIKDEIGDYYELPCNMR